MLDDQFGPMAIFTSRSDAIDVSGDIPETAPAAKLESLGHNYGESRDSFEARVADWYGWNRPDYDIDHARRIMADRDSLWKMAMEAEAREFRRRHGGVENFYDAGFAAWRLGWQTVPQDRTEGREPSKIRGSGRLRWGVYTMQRISDADVDAFVGSAPNANTAFVSGPGGDDTFFVDCDIDGANGDVVRRLLRTYLGPTPFVRTRLNSSRFAMVFRGAGVEKARFRTLVGDVEILGKSATGTGSLITAFGIHGRDYQSLPEPERHRGQFVWSPSSPRTSPPSDAPMVFEDQIARFEAALYRELGTPPEPERRVIEAAHYDGTLVRPSGAGAVPGVRYENGLAVDGREAWMTDRTYTWFALNPSAPLDVLIAAVKEEARAHIKISVRWLGLDREVEQRMSQLQRKHAAGNLRLRSTYVGEDGARYAAVSVTPTSSSDDDIVALAGTKRTAIRLAESSAPNAILAAQRALMDEKSRAVETNRVALAVRDGIQAWLDALWDGDDAAAKRLIPVWLMVAPTGAGKTTTLLRLLAEQVANRGPLGRSVVLMLPSYNNIAEAEGRMAEFVAEAQVVGLRTVVYKGKVAGGCLVADQMVRLMNAGIGTSGLCEADVDVRTPGEGIETVHEVCEHANVCPVLQNRRDAQDCDLLLMPMAFLGLPMQRAIRDSIAGVVVDERSWPEFIENRTFPIDALTLPRGGTYATEGEIDDVIYPDETPKARTARRRAIASGDIVLTQTQKDRRKDVRMDVIAAMEHDRDAIAIVAMQALREGKRVAQAVLDHNAEYGGRTVTGLTMAENAKRVCGRSADRRKFVRPNMTNLAINDVATAPRGSWLWQEVAFWSVVLDDVERIEKGIATGATDARLQLLDRGVPCVVDAKDSNGHPIVMGESIRVSWRTKSTFADKPTMLMDASASPEIVEKLWNGRAVSVIKIDAPLHMRVVWANDSTWADSSYCPTKSVEDGKCLAASRNLYHLRNVITSLGGLFGHGHVVVGSTKTGRDAIFSGWPGPVNVRSMHAGAVAGLDFAKHDKAALCVGRMEVPIRVIDAIVAALTYDDPIPEQPIDRLGTGMDEDGRGLRPNKGMHKVPMRDGSDVGVIVPMHAGHWARIVQQQHREENTRQFIGRLRPVYREGEPPLVVVMSSIIPDGIVVDEIVHSADLAANFRLWESVRRREMLEPACKADRDLSDNRESEFDVVNRARYELQIKSVAGTRIGKGLVEAQAIFEGGKRMQIFLPAWTDTQSFAARYMEYWRHDTLLCVNVISRGAPVGASIPRPLDAAFETRVGTWEERATAERRDRESALVDYINNWTPDETPANLALGVGTERGPLGVKIIYDNSKR